MVGKWTRRTAQYGGQHSQWLISASAPPPLPYNVNTACRVSFCAAESHYLVVVTHHILTQSDIVLCSGCCGCCEPLDKLVPHWTHSLVLPHPSNRSSLRPADTERTQCDTQATHCNAVSRGRPCRVQHLSAQWTCCRATHACRATCSKSSRSSTMSFVVTTFIRRITPSLTPAHHLLSDSTTVVSSVRPLVHPTLLLSAINVSVLSAPSVVAVGAGRRQCAASHASAT